MEKRCEWCGKVFETPTKKTRFCSGKCRTAHYRAKKDGIRLKKPMKTPPALEKKVSEDDVARQVAVLHGISAFFSYAAGEGPQKTAPLCLLLSQRIDSMLKEVGIG